ncbi:MAG: type II toxin-antitoxin system PemK/MazF family toxin [Gracilibacteraceae bacterium]|jgi:mRNA-degrading endonuclease toxin of MazEF toxin-antitoxin module|nr:type II toxin-antitoxin system PemK/MazF family toxin [Gracilibacteraceae bacterium]
MLLEHGQAKQGNIIRTNFNPQSGHEQGGPRPAVIVSNNVFNEKVNLILACPITNAKKYYENVVQRSRHLNGYVALVSRVSFPLLIMSPETALKQFYQVVIRDCKSCMAHV